MRIEVTMPNMGYEMEEGKVVSWLKQVGDQVARGEVIAEIVVAEGDVAAVGAVIAYLEGDA